LWRNYRPESLATPEAFERDPKTVQEWYDWRRGIVASIEPNAGHRAIARLSAPVITQNVDGLHQLAGSGRVLEVHGSIWLTRCTGCGRETRDLETKLAEPCAACGGKLRPGVVWFGESLPEEVWQDAVETVRECDLLLVVGTSSVVYPAAGLAAMARRARVIEVNLEETPLSGSAHLALRGKAGEILPMLVKE
jgi:NAD-dependent deacetylase